MTLLSILDLGFIASLAIPVVVAIIGMQMTLNDVDDAENPRRYFKQEKRKWALLLCLTSVFGSLVTYLAGKESEDTLKSIKSLSQVSADLSAISNKLDAQNSQKLDRLDTISNQLSVNVDSVRNLTNTNISLSTNLTTASANIFEYVTRGESHAEVSMIPWYNNTIKIGISNQTKYPVNVLEVKILDEAMFIKLSNSNLDTSPSERRFEKIGTLIFRNGIELGYLNADLNQKVMKYNITIWQENGRFEQTFMLFNISNKWHRAVKVAMFTGFNSKKIYNKVDKEITKGMLPKDW